MNDQLYPQTNTDLTDDPHYIKLEYLIKGVFDNVEMDKMLTILEDILERPAIITDMAFHIMSETPSVAAAYHSHYPELSYLDASFTSLIRSHYIFSKIKERAFISATLEHPVLGTFLLATIKVHTADVLMLLVLESGKPFLKYDLDLIKKVSRILSVEYQKESVVNNNRLLLPNRSISSLLDGAVLTREELLSSNESVPWITQQELYLMIIRTDESSDLNARLVSTLNSLRFFLPLEHCTTHKSDIIAFLTPDLFEKLYLREVAEFSQFLSENHLCGAISRRFFDIMDCRRYYLMASKLLDIAKRFRNTFVYFEDMRYHIIADLIDGAFDISDFCHPAIGRLIDFDQKNHTDMLETLDCYLKYKANPNLAAEKLYIHRSTLFYRIKKIREITELNLEDTDELAELYFSLKMTGIFGKEKGL